MKNSLKLLVLPLALGLAGCASVMDGTTQSISVETPPVNGALCSLQNNKGKWFVNNTPGSVVVHRSYQNLVVNCSKNGYGSATQNVKSTLQAAIAGNIIIGGGVGASIDAMDGAAYKYPGVISVPLNN